MLPKQYSFRLLSRHQVKVIRLERRAKKHEVVVAQLQAEQQRQLAIDSRKRTFLKLASVVGLGAAGSLLLPKKASALVFGSSPASNTVGIKNSSNTRIDPATEATALSVKTATEGTKTAADSIKTNTDTLVTNSNKFTFSDGSLLVSSSGTAAEVVGLKDSQDTRINPATDDALVLLRRMVKLMESQATVDTANRQRVTVDAWGTSVLTGTGTSTSVPRVALATDSTVGTVTSVTNVATIGSYQTQQMFGDVAHGVYANAIRRNLVFS